MIVVEQQTWVTLVGIAGFCLALTGYLRNITQDLKAEIGGLRTDLKTEIRGVDTKIDRVSTDLKTDIAGLNTKIDRVSTDLKTDIAGLKTDIGRLDARMITLENRTYDIAARLPPVRETTLPNTP